MNKVSIIAAIGLNHALGADNALIWDLPDDWQNFRRVTAGKPFVIGRRSYQAEDALLSDTLNLVVSRQDNIELLHSFDRLVSVEETIQYFKTEPEIFITGGGRIYETFLPHTTYLYLTIVHENFQADTFFPPIDWREWSIVESVYHPKDDHHKYSFSLCEYARKDK
jgi:dihydrofolate reductase